MHTAVSFDRVLISAVRGWPAMLGVDKGVKWKPAPSGYLQFCMVRKMLLSVSPHPTPSFLSGSYLQRCLALKCKVMNAMCVCGWFHSFLEMLWFGYYELLRAETNENTANEKKWDRQTKHLSEGRDGSNWGKEERPEASRQYCLALDP